MSSAPIAPCLSKTAMESEDYVEVSATGEVTEPPPQPADDAVPVDLVFLMDCTGSMSDHIAASQAAINEVINQIAQGEMNLQVGFIAFRDYKQMWCNKLQHSGFVTKVHELTDNTSKLCAWINNLRAGGGFDTAEAVDAALHELNEMKFREGSTRVAVMVADAPPHGLGSSGDGFPNGVAGVEFDDDGTGKPVVGYDPVVEINKLVAKGDIPVYTLPVSNVLRNEPKSVAFYTSLAERTGGTCIMMANPMDAVPSVVAALRSEFDPAIKALKKTKKLEKAHPELTREEIYEMACKEAAEEEIEIEDVRDEFVVINPMEGFNNREFGDLSEMRKALSEMVPSREVSEKNDEKLRALERASSGAPKMKREKAAPRFRSSAGEDEEADAGEEAEEDAGPTIGMMRERSCSGPASEKGRGKFGSAVRKASSRK